MVNIVQSVIAVGIIMLIGWLGRRLGMLPDNTDKVLTDVVYWFLAPAMLFSTIMGADLHEAIGKPFLVAIIAGLSTVVFFFTTAWLIFRPKLPDLTMGAMGAALNNAAMIGIPISTYVLGNGIHSVPIMLFQLGFLTPTFFVCADLLAADSKPTFKLVTKSVVTNPMLISAVLGFLVSWFQIPLPGLVTIPAELVGEAGSAVVLIAFGASIYGKRLRLSNRTGYMALYSTFGKVVVQPIIALGVAYSLGMRGESMMAVVVMAAMPTANNAFVIATRAKVDPKGTQETILLTTACSLPMVILITWVFHQFFL